MIHPQRQSACFLAVSFITTGRPLSTLMTSDVHTTSRSTRRIYPAGVGHGARGAAARARIEGAG